MVTIVNDYTGGLNESKFKWNEYILVKIALQVECKTSWCNIKKKSIGPTNKTISILECRVQIGFSISENCLFTDYDETLNSYVS